MAYSHSDDGAASGCVSIQSNGYLTCS